MISFFLSLDDLMMAASSSREPRNIPLPASPIPHKEANTASKRKGKGKEQPSGLKRRVPPTSKPSSKDAERDWDWTSLTDSHISKVPPVFTKDGSYFFSLAGPSVKIYSVATGQIVSTLTAPRSLPASSNVLTSALLNPHNAFQLITGSANGYIRIWDFLDAQLLKSIDISYPIHFLCAHEKYPDIIFASVTRPGKNKGRDHNGVVLKISLKTKDASGEFSSELSSIGKTRCPTGLAISRNGEWLVTTAGTKAYVTSLSASTPRFTKFVSSEIITCLAFHPSEDYFATGDVKGNIRLWYCLNDEVHIKSVGVPKKTQTASFHWHAHAVSSLIFTSNGAYLLSGGEEAVLVIWQLESGKKEFVPRLGAAISNLALSKVGRDEEYLVGLADGTYLFISVSPLQVTRSYSRIRLDPAVHDGASTSTAMTPTPLAIHPTSSTIILPSSHPSSLQIFSTTSSRIISELEVSPSNRVSRRDEKSLEPSRVELVVLSSSGDWMATVDRREGDSLLHGEVYLKIWSFDRQTAFWILNTRIDRPHGSHKVLDVAFSPVQNSSSSLLVTTGEDNNIKVWRLRRNKNHVGADFWVARSTFDFRSETPKKVSWSPDASLFSIAFDNHVVLYDPVTTTPQRIMTTAECAEVSSAHFVGHNGRYLAILSVRTISVWDLVFQTVIWHCRQQNSIEKIVSNANEDSFTIISSFGGSTHASVFSCASSQPLLARKLPFLLRAVVSRASHFIGITQDWTVVHFGDGVSKNTEEGATARGIQASSTSPKNTLFEDIFGKSAFGEIDVVQVPMDDVSRASQIPSLFDGPSYMMPPLSSLFEETMAGFIDSRLSEPSVQDECDVEMETIDEQPVSARRSQPFREIDMDTFTKLFKQHSLQPKLPRSSRPTVITNGTTKMNGKLNGHSHDRKRPTHPTQSQPPDPPPSSSPVAMTTGKKRKKSNDI